jgi:DMSO/TMAO reductase YedYZ molybdopterin-dependent catalytic subunit
MGWIAGASAAALAGLALLLMRALFGGPTAPEVVQDAIVQATPGPVFSFLLDRLRFAGRPLLFLSILVGMFAVGGVVGSLWWRAPRPAWASLAVWASLSALVGLASGVWLSTAVAAAVFVAALHALSRGDASGDPSRRRMLAATGGSLALLSLLGWRALAQVGTPVPRPPPADTSAHPTPDVTPVGVFYNVSKNFVDPTVAEAGWTLRVDGHVDSPYELTLAGLRAMPSIEQPATLCCISNEVGGDLIGNAHWRGVRLADLLGRAGVRPGAVDVVFHCRDDYQDSIALERAVMPGTLLVYEMNGAPLTPKHGFPARVLVPGIYGMKNAKWVHRIQVHDADFQGFWQRQGWNDLAAYRTMSRLDYPTRFTRPDAGPAFIHGIAFSGERGIGKVEVSVDGGPVWREATLTPATGPFSWVRWSLEWDAPASERVTLRVRAFDSRGEPQEEVHADPFPDGSAGYHTVQVQVRAAEA